GNDMQSQHYYLANPNQTQVIFSKIFTQVLALYERFVPHEVRNRRNIHLQKQSDVVDGIFLFENRIVV
ncbi:TPA: hypothetical protein ACGOZW_002246, partial [Streptococcus suis]